MVKYRQGAKAGDSYTVVVATGASGIDMTTVTDITGKVEKPDGSELTWSAMTLTSATTSGVTATYNFTSTSPFKVPGIYRFHGVITYPGGEMYTEEAEILVKALHEV